MTTTLLAPYIADQNHVYANVTYLDSGSNSSPLVMYASYPNIIIHAISCQNSLCVLIWLCRLSSVLSYHFEEIPSLYRKPICRRLYALDLFVSAVRMGFYHQTINSQFADISWLLSISPFVEVLAA